MPTNQLDCLPRSLVLGSEVARCVTHTGRRRTTKTVERRKCTSECRLSFPFFAALDRQRRRLRRPRREGRRNKFQTDWYRCGHRTSVSPLSLNPYPLPRTISHSHSPCVCLLGWAPLWQKVSQVRPHLSNLSGESCNFLSEKSPSLDLALLQDGGRGRRQRYFVSAAVACPRSVGGTSQPLRV